MDGCKLLSTFVDLCVKLSDDSSKEIGGTLDKPLVENFLCSCNTILDISHGNTLS